MIFILKRWLKQIKCKDKWRVSAEGRYVGIGTVDVYHLECWCYKKKKDVITYKNKPE